MSLMKASTSRTRLMAASAASSRSKRLMAACHLSVAVAVRVGQSRSAIESRPPSVIAGTSPSKYFTVIAVVRLAQFPKVFTKSAL